MILTYKYKLYSNKKNKYLHQLIDISGIIYNHSIALKKRYYKLYKKSLSMYQLQKHITKLKKIAKYSYWSMIGSQAIQEITERIEKGYKRFFDYTKGKLKLKTSPPTFKRVKSYKSFTLKGNVGYKITGNTIKINSIKKSFKFWLSRDIDGKIKTVTIKRDNIGDLYICVALAVKKDKHNNTTSRKTVGIDFGMKTFLTFSDNTTIQSPLHFLSSLSKTKMLNRSLSKKKRGSQNRKKAKITLAKHHIKIANQRKDFFYKLANELADKFETIFVEDLDMKSMQRKWGRKISDLSYSYFLEILLTKTNVIKIDRYYASSKICRHCNQKNDNLEITQREWVCSNCNITLDRDLNASINIHRVGTSTLSSDTVRPSK
jgi:putative transposase